MTEIVVFKWEVILSTILDGSFKSLILVIVSLDIFYQFFNGKDIFGFETIGSGRRLAGPFGDELIAGGSLQRFSIFSFFLLPLFFYHQSVKYSKYLIPILFFIFFSGIILSGNRMPMILFIFTTLLILIFQKQTRMQLLKQQKYLKVIIKNLNYLKKSY